MCEMRPNQEKNDYLRKSGSNTFFITFASNLRFCMMLSYKNIFLKTEALTGSKRMVFV
jgi:hypothetical protein